MKQLFHQFRFSAQSVALLAASLMASIIFLLIIANSITAHASATSDKSSGSQSLITIHDGQTTHAIMTRDDTLGKALQDAGISTADQDLVEPGLSTKLTVSSYDVNIYRARPITIVDGAVKKSVMSPYRTADQIVSHAGMQLHDEDRTMLTPNSHVIADGPGLTLKIDRATAFTLDLYGKQVAAYTQGQTVEDMLAEKQIHLAKTDTVSQPLAAPIITGMTVEIWRNGVQTATNQEPIPFATQQIQNADQPVGFKQVQTPGVDGSKMVTYEITMQNGQQVAKKEIQSVVVTQPVQQVEVVGTKVNLPPGSHTDWMAAAGISPSDYGYADYIIRHESGWRYNAQGYSTTYGLCQAYPGSKMASAGGDWQTNPITQLRWCSSYTSRYGSWQAAYNHWLVNHNW